MPHTRRDPTDTTNGTVDLGKKIMSDDNSAQYISEEMMEEVQYWAERPIQDESVSKTSVEYLRETAKAAVRHVRNMENSGSYHAAVAAYNEALRAIDALADAVRVAK